MTSNQNVALEFTSPRALSTGMAWPSLGDVFCLVAPLLQIVELPVAGVLLLSDLVLLAAFPIALLRHPERLRQKPVPTILMLGTFWLFSQIVTDLLRSSAPEDYLRGWTKICFVLVNFTVVWLVVCGSRRRFLLYGVGLGLGTILSYYLHPSMDAVISPWKFGIGIPITMLIAILVANFSGNRFLGILLPLSILAVVHVFQDFRILAVISFITAIYSLFLLSSARKQQAGGLRLAMLALLVCGGITAFTLVYSHYALQGAFGSYAQRKLEAQSGEGGMLLGGRGEILASTQAILDSPLLGHGSWARDPTYAAIMDQRRTELGYKHFQGGKSKDDLIPTHSYIFGSWVDAGLAGGIFWLFMLGFTIYTIFSASGVEPLLPLFAFTGLMLIWDILFSPLGTPTRFVAPYFVAAVVLFRSFQTAPPAFGWDN
jgi:hypothetical protein